MSSCEKCWRDAEGDVDDYRARVKNCNCSPEDEAGPDATVCKACKRRTVHQHSHLCQVPGCLEGEYIAP